MFLFIIGNNGYRVDGKSVILQQRGIDMGQYYVYIDKSIAPIKLQCSYKITYSRIRNVQLQIFRLCVLNWLFISSIFLKIILHHTDGVWYCLTFI